MVDNNHRTEFCALVPVRNLQERVGPHDEAPTTEEEAAVIAQGLVHQKFTELKEPLRGLSLLVRTLV